MYESTPNGTVNASSWAEVSIRLRAIERWTVQGRDGSVRAHDALAAIEQLAAATRELNNGDGE